MSDKDGLQSFRAEARAWLDENAPAGIRNLPEGGGNICWGGRKWVWTSEDEKLWLERCAAKGWTVPDWPVEYGGAGLTPEQTKIIHQEMRRLAIRKPVESLGIHMLGPALLKYGTPEQKAEHLPPIARGEIRWAQGYSEPGAGSDLASLSMRCEDKGDHYLVNGTKIWTSYGDKADMIFTLVRTNFDVPKQQGISFLLIDMESPGLSTAPIRLISGDSPFTSTFFDEVKVPKGNMVGQPGQGWAIAKYLLRFEREMIGAIQNTSIGVEPLAMRAKALLGEEGLRRDAAMRDAISRYETDNWAFRLFIDRARDLGKAGQPIPTTGSIMKIGGTELVKRQSAILMSLTGVDGLTEGSGPLFDWLHAPIGPIAGGSNEIQLNILAKRALELPEG